MDWKVGMRVKSTYFYHKNVIGTIIQLNTYVNDKGVWCHRVKWDTPSEYDDNDFSPEFLMSLTKLHKVLE